MNPYILIFRMDVTTPEMQPTPEVMERYMADWGEWINSIDREGKLAEGGNHLSPCHAKVLRSEGRITEGPYTVNHESVAGYIIVEVENMEDAIRIAQKCPILKGDGTSVEVREVAMP